MHKTNYPKNVTIVEVGPRDGLQNEPTFVSSDTKIDFINQLSATGLKRIEVTSFVSVKSIPKLSDCSTVFSQITKPSHVRFSALIPNEQGMHNALEAGVREIAVFTAASETFNQRNIHCSIAESISRFIPVIAMAKQHDIFVRGYISCVLGCPYEGEVSPLKVAKISQQLLNLGVNEISLGDTIGVGTPKQTAALLHPILKVIPVDQVALHFHDTYGQAIANIYAALECGVSCFDSSVAGLGGCPYAKGASGNVATEDVLYLLHGLGITTGIDLYKIVRIGDMISKKLGRQNQSKVANALLRSGCCISR
ncbi:MAG: hydroxymethylglutaryl-CoA lyase [Legionellales bacterium RIFCSPHIGHO2_12_FULL_42_9]|nr:MAG: hydroxymethylglutaryl-CoA lyase [Legionellales bacterium RIFCSPHIGHO2_12_FULL_42_9]